MASVEADDIEEQEPKTGRMIKEDGTVKNIAELITTNSNGKTALRAVSSN